MLLYLVHGTIVLHVGEEDGHVDNVGKRGALGLEDHIDAIIGDEESERLGREFARTEMVDNPSE